MKIRDKVLIIEDEPNISSFISAILSANDYDTMIAQNGRSAVATISSHCPDIILLDLGLPDMDGISILKFVREWSTCPVIVISARNHENDKVEALDAGADDYLTKPFASKELLARVRALTRRYETYNCNTLTLGNTTLDCNHYTLTSKQKTTKLNNKEFQLMELFLRYPKQVFSTERLMDIVWELDSNSELDVVWTHISYLRKKLKAIHSDIEIKTIRGAGYLLEEK